MTTTALEVPIFAKSGWRSVAAAIQAAHSRVLPLTGALRHLMWVNRLRSRHVTK